MNRTGLFLAAAGLLALVALIAGVPRLTHHDGPGPQPVVVTPPQHGTTGAGSLSMQARLSHPFISLGQQDVFATADLQAVSVNGERKPVNLALVIDRSGSMSGFKLNQAKEAARQLVAQLRPSDRLALVHYGSDVKSMDGLMATPENKQRLLAFIDAIWDDGGTNIGAGLSTARDLLLTARSDFNVNRVILISDGQPTEGLVETSQLTALAREIRSYGVSLSSIGVGDDFNEQLMAAFAEVGAGAYAYLQDASQLSSIFQRDLDAAGTQVARGVTLTFKVPRGAQLLSVLGHSQVTRRHEGDSELVTVALPDFAASQQERLVAHLVVTGARPEETLDVTGLELQYEDLLGHGARQAEASLSAHTTSQQQVVLDNRDKDAIVFAARARAAENSERAAEYIEQGDRAAAEAELQKNAILFDEAKSVAGASAVQADLDNLSGASSDLRSGYEGKALQKKIRTQARKDYGLMGSTY